MLSSLATVCMSSTILSGLFFAILSTKISHVVEIGTVYFLIVSVCKIHFVMNGSTSVTYRTLYCQKVRVHLDYHLCYPFSIPCAFHIISFSSIAIVPLLIIFLGLFICFVGEVYFLFEYDHLLCCLIG